MCQSGELFCRTWISGFDCRSFSEEGNDLRPASVDSDHQCPSAEIRAFPRREDISASAVFHAQDSRPDDCIHVACQWLRLHSGESQRHSLHSFGTQPPEIAKHDPNLIRLAVRYFRYADRMVVLNKGAFRFMCQEMGVPPERIVTIPNVCEKTVPCRTERLMGHSCLLAVDRLIRMSAEIAKLHPDEHLVICCDGRERENLEKLAALLRLSDKIHFQGECRNLAPWDRHADVLCFTSHYDGWPNVIMEAMMQGLPVIAFNCHYGPSEMISSHRCGILVPQDDESCDIRETAEYLDRLPESRAPYSVEAARSISVFAAEKIYPRWEAIAEGKKQEQSA